MFDIPESALARPDPVPPEWFAAKAESLALELAMELDDPEDIINRHGLTEQQFLSLQSIPAFREMLELHRSAWNAAENTVERIEKKAALALERALLPVARVASSADTNDAVLIQAAKFLKDASPLGDRSRQMQGAGGNIEVNINLDGTPIKMAFTPVPDAIEADA